MTITLVLGGVRAGKSARALSLATQLAGGDAVLFVATAQAFDDEMRRRIAAHREERPSHWQTLEEPLRVAEVLETAVREAKSHIGAIVIDCVTLWVSNLLLAMEQPEHAEQLIGERTEQLIAWLRRVRAGSGYPVAPRHIILVSNEVGLGIVPPTALGRQYRDALGRANQLLAAAADNVLLMVAGLEIPLKPRM